MKHKFNKILLILLFAPLLLSEQKSLIQQSSRTLTRLSTTQLANYEKIKQHNNYKGIYLIETGKVPDIESSNNITLDLSFLACPKIVFVASDVTKDDDDNFSWSGKAFSFADNVATNATITLQKNNGLLIGNIAIDNRSFELYDLTGGCRHLPKLILIYPNMRVKIAG
jgi:hypothetical protein